MNKLLAATFAFIAWWSSSYAQTPPTYLNVKDYGAICDGGNHPLSNTYSTLAAAQAVYPFITSLTQQIDYAALKKTSNVAFGADGSEHAQTNPQLNLPIFIPPGICNLGSDTWLIRKASGIKINGGGATATTITSSSIALGFDGLWYSEIGNMTVKTSSSSAITALDIDGNVPGHPYATFGAQGSTFPNLSVDGGNSTYAVSICRQGGSGGQCSGLTFTNPNFQRASFAVYYQNGYNALTNQLIGGDMQNYPTNGIFLNAGSLNIFGMSFESTQGYTQLVNGGCDINASSSGTFDPIVVHGVRSESLCFYKGEFSQLADLSGILIRPAALQNWSANTYYPLNTIVVGGGVGTGTRAFRVTIAGTSGGTEPTWPTSGTVVDGGVTWTRFTYNVISFPEGSFNRANSFLDYTASVFSGTLPSASACGGTSSANSGSTRWVGSVTEGVGGTGCNLQIWPLNYSPHMNCVVSNRDKTAFSYTQDGSNLIVTNTALVSPSTFDWICSQ